MVAVQRARYSLTNSERIYNTFEREEAAIVFALKKVRHHLFGGSFIWYTDHKVLRAAFEKVDIDGRFTSWLEVMAMYVFEILYVQCK